MVGPYFPISLIYTCEAAQLLKPISIPVTDKAHAVWKAARPFPISYPHILLVIQAADRQAGDGKRRNMALHSNSTSLWCTITV